MFFLLMIILQSTVIKLKKKKFWNSNRFGLKSFNYLRFTLFQFVTGVKGNKIYPLLHDQEIIYKLWFRERFSCTCLNPYATNKYCIYIVQVYAPVNAKFIVSHLHVHSLETYVNVEVASNCETAVVQCHLVNFLNDLLQIPPI